MIPFIKKTFCFSLVFTFIVAIFGCSSSVRHISSDVCLVKQGNSQKEVIDILGSPKVKTETPKGEMWTYYVAQKSPLKRTPGMNLLFGTVTYDVIYVTFQDNIVANCQYRHANEQEFKRAQIDPKAEE